MNVKFIKIFMKKNLNNQHQTKNKKNATGNSLKILGLSKRSKAI